LNVGELTIKVADPSGRLRLVCRRSMHNYIARQKDADGHLDIKNDNW